MPPTRNVVAPTAGGFNGAGDAGEFAPVRQFRRRSVAPAGPPLDLDPLSGALPHRLTAGGTGAAETAFRLGTPSGRLIRGDGASKVAMPRPDSCPPPRTPAP